MIGLGTDGNPSIFRVDRGEPRAIPGLDRRDRTAGFTGDDHSIYVYNTAGLPSNVSVLDITTGKRKLWKTIVPADPAGVDSIGNFIFTPNGKSYVYSYSRSLSDLYLVEGLK